MLVVRRRRAPVQIPPRGQVPGLGRPSAIHVEEDREAVRVEEAPGAAGAGNSPGSESYSSGVDLVEGH